MTAAEALLRRLLDPEFGFTEVHALPNGNAWWTLDGELALNADEVALLASLGAEPEET